MKTLNTDAVLQKLATHAWEGEVRWADIMAWSANFTGKAFDVDEERVYAKYALSRFMYFGKRLVREMLHSLYREHFESPLRQRLRRNLRHTRDKSLIDKLYLQELRATRFVAVGNPAESGAHLLYYFRQINRLPKDLFVDCAAAFAPTRLSSGAVALIPHDKTVKRYIFFDDFVGSGDQAVKYLYPYLNGIRAAPEALELRFLSLFATSNGLTRLNDRTMFREHASCLFELDESFRAFDGDPRYFTNSPASFDLGKLRSIMQIYGAELWPRYPLGYEDGQVLIGFSHNTPDNTPPVFWNEGRSTAWAPVFIRYDKNYGSSTP